MYKNFPLFLLFLIATICLAQDEEFIFGQLIDTTKNEPVPFATIRIKGKALGVISNSDGTFKIPLKYKTFGDFIEISCMGFDTRVLRIQDLVVGKRNIIVLKPGSFDLTEAVVTANIKKLTAREIVKKAVNNISKNYPKDAFGLVGYYRDYQVKNSQYTNLNEAVIRVLDDGFAQKDNFNNRYQLLSYERNEDFELDFFGKQPYDYKNRNKIVPNAKMINDGGNEFVTLSIHDAIRNYGRESFSFIDHIASDFVETHNFKRRGITNFKKEQVYEIHFTYENRQYKAEGSIYINKDDFAILKLDYFVFKIRNPKDIDHAVNSSERYSDSFKKMNRELIYHIQTEYVRGHENKMFLNYISFYNKLLIRRPKGFSSRFVLDLTDNIFKIRVSTIPNRLDKIKSSDFKIYYKEKRLPIKDFYFLEDERTFMVVPNWENYKAKGLLTEIFTERKNLKISDIRYSYDGIKDSLGNKLDERKLEYIHQYREFFTQETRPDKWRKIDVEDLMIKSLPLDSSKQPVVNQDMKNEYWMNTPLKGFNAEVKTDE